MKVYDKILAGEGKVGVIGLGYVGLPIALEFAKDVDVVGFDINEERVQLMQNGKDPSHEVLDSEFKDKRIVFTSDPRSTNSPVSIKPQVDAFTKVLSE